MFTNSRWALRLALPQSASMLALLLLLHHATARDAPREPHIVTKIASCPDVGYYFTRDSNRNAIEPACHLCFCQDNDTAVCWQRDIRRCDVKDYHHYGRKRRISRARRSPGLSDIFFKDAAKDVFDKNTPEECKPYESSYSEGCPPADWCIGCTVCDCNANGRWDCHVLSFCPDGKGKKKMKKKRGKVKKRQASKQAASTTTKKPKPKITQKPNKKNPTRKFSKQTVWRKQRRPDNVPAKPKNKAQKVIPPASKATISTKNPAPKSKEKLNKKIIKKSKNQPALQIVKRKTKTLHDDEEVVTNITNTIFQKVMASVEKMINESQKSITQAIQQKFLQKRSMSTHYNNEDRKNNKPKPKFKNLKKRPKFMKNNQNLKSNKSRRSKRQIPAMISSKYYSQEANVTNRTNINVTENSTVYHTLDNDTVFVIPIAKMLTKPSYIKYTVGFEMENANFTSKNLNGIRKERFLIVKIAKNASNEVISNTVQKNSSKDQSKNDFSKEFMNMSKVLIMNYADNGNNITNKLDTNFALKSNIACGKILSKFKKTFINLFEVNEMNTTIPIRYKRKKLNILKYLNRIFRKVFVTRKYKNKSSMKTMRQSNRKHNLIKSIRKKFKSYKVDLKNKINELKAESKKIMKSIRSIKGLLKLLDIDTKKIKENSTIINTQFLSNDIEKLNAIIKDEYEVYYAHNNLTDTQSLQVSYIKQNTKIFTQSLENFAQILNDIVEILTNRKTHHSKVFNDYFRKPKNQAYTKINKNNTMEEKLSKIKELLTNYNLVQNKFMKRLYDVIITLGTKTNQTTTNVMVNKNNNNTDAIEIYTQNIIKNLKKLKNLTQKLSCKNRRKRQAMEDDDVIEYLLILMEYLLKQQTQLIISPANEGIDLLIEAIRTAPDIKTTRTKVLDYSLVTIKTVTTEATSALLIPSEIIDETNVTANSKFKTFESIDDDEESNDFYQYNKKFRKSNNIKKAMFETKNIKKEDIMYPLTTPSYLTDDTETNTVLDKTKKKDNDKKFKLFIDSIDEDDGLISTTTKSADESAVREFVTPRLNRQMKTTLSVLKLRDEESVGKDSNDTSQNNRIKLDWIEKSDTQEDERKELLRFKETTTKKLLLTRDYKSTRQTRLQVATRSAGNKERKVDKYDDPISSISKETTYSKRNKYLSSEYVMYKKQMNLLNSLDYGTEKIEMEADSNEENSNVEQFPSYFK